MDGCLTFIFYQKYFFTIRWSLSYFHVTKNAFLLSLVLTLNIFYAFFCCFYCWLWTCKCLLISWCIFLRKKKTNYDNPEIYLGPWSISELEHFGKAFNDWVLKTYLYYISLHSHIFQHIYHPGLLCSAVKILGRPDNLLLFDSIAA